MWEAALQDNFDEEDMFKRFGGSYAIRFRQVEAFRYKLRLKPRLLTNPPRVELHWGATGTGKTSYCLEHFPPTEAYWATSSRWFDGYKGEQTIVFDEFRGKQNGDDSSIPLSELLKLLDRGPYLAPVKGGFIQIRADCFIFTSNLRLQQWYYYNEEELAAMERRFTLVKEYKKV